MLEQIKQALRGTGILTYDAMEVSGVCQRPYVAAYDGGVDVLPGTKGMFGTHNYEVMCVVPYPDVAALPVLVGKVKGALAPLTTMTLQSTTPTEPEETYRARTVTLVYTHPERLR